MDRPLLEETCRIAFAGLIYDIDRFGRFSDQPSGEAAAAAFASSDSRALPPLGENIFSPSGFSNRVLRVLEEADHISAGFKTEKPQKNLSQRLFSLTECIQIENSRRPKTRTYSFIPQELSPESIFAVKGTAGREDSDESRIKALWAKFRRELTESIPPEVRGNWPLWLDYFDTLWLNFTALLPAGEEEALSDVSLYDRSNIRAAAAAALWRYETASAKSKDDQETQKILLIQGDFYGIQNFIFAGGSATQKAAAKLLRGRSFYVSLLCELAALRVLEELSLPPTSQIINAAGKFMIAAPNTPDTVAALQKLQQKFDGWFITNTLGTSGLGLAWTPASLADFTAQNRNHRFSELMRKLYANLETRKFQRLNLCAKADVVMSPDYSEGVSVYDSRLPKRSLLPQDEITAGECLVRKTRLLIFEAESESAFSFASDAAKPLGQTIFGYRVVFSDEQEAARLARSSADNELHRCWDFALASEESDPIWHGCAHRNINGYVARFDNFGEKDDPKYQGADAESISEYSLVKSFDFLACEDRRKAPDGTGEGIRALCALKGDIDNLGLIFQKGLPGMNFSRMASLSRQINQFFSFCLPVLCRKYFPSAYTVFAGGDDFFLIGPWLSMQRLALLMQEKFSAFACNEEIHFSCGLTIFKPGMPLRDISALAEGNLSEAKAAGKNRAFVHGIPVTWPQWKSLMSFADRLEAESTHLGLSTSYIYSLFELCEMASKTADPLASMWRSKLFYRTARFAEKLPAPLQEWMRSEWLPELARLIEGQGRALRIPLSNFFYQRR